MIKTRLLTSTFLLILAIQSLDAAAGKSAILNDYAYSDPASKSWVEKYVEHYPEILWLADIGIRKTEEGQANRKGSYSEQLFNQQFVEFDRTLMTLHVLKLILKGGDAAYQELTADQAMETRLSRESFAYLHHQGQRLLKSNWGGMTEQQMDQTMKTALVLGDMGKSEKARELFHPLNANAPDHDDFYEEMIQLLAENPQLCPSFFKLPPQAKSLLSKVANLAHYGHITHLEGSASMFDKLRSSHLPSDDDIALSFDLFIHTCDVAGALGHVNPRSSLTLTETTFRALTAAGDAVRLLANSDKTSADAYNAYLNTRAVWLGLNPETRVDQILTRVGAMLRLFTVEEGKLLKQAFAHLDLPEQEKLINSLDAQKGELLMRTPTYMPAVLVNLYNNQRLGHSKTERLQETIKVGLPILSKILDEHKKAVACGQADPSIPLNFNQIAAVAKTDPKFFLRPFWIDKEGNAILIEAVIFDCDGVLVDTECLKFLAWKEALASRNISFTVEEYMPLVGHSSKNILQMISQLKGIDIEETVVDLRDSKYYELQRQGVSPFPNIVEYVIKLSKDRKSHELKLGLASSAPKEEIMNNLKQIGLENAFDLIISGADDLENYVDTEGKNKPKPYIYIELAKRLNVNPSRCLVFEDTAAGVEAAYNAGMMPLAVPNRFTSEQDFSKAKATINPKENLPFNTN